MEFWRGRADTTAIRCAQDSEVPILQSLALIAEEFPARGFRTLGRFVPFILVGSALLSVCLTASPTEAQSRIGSDAMVTGAPDQPGAALQEFERSLAKVKPLLDRYGYTAAFITVLAEGMGIPTPGQTMLMAGALEAATGGMNLLLLLFLVTMAATLGNSVGYAIGRWGGRVALDKLKVNPKRQQYIDDLFERRGGLAILLARFIDGLRQLNGIVAGILRMPWWTFTAYNAAGALLWTCTWGIGTYYFGRDIHGIAHFFHRHDSLLFGLSTAAVLALLVYLLISRLPNKAPKK
jgi:membrane protein DedA with SNARE-associated domain